MKRAIVIRVRIAFLFVALFSIAVIWKILHIQIAEGAKWEEKANMISYQYKPVVATRGNIYSDNGSLIATSLPFYKLAIDPTVASDELFFRDIDSLAILLNHYFGDKSIASYKNTIRNARNEGRQYLPLSRRQINYHEKKKISRWPILREGRYKGGAVFEKVDKRFLPFEGLSKRTIGFVNENNRGAGLEYSFNDLLKGKNGEALYQKIAGGNWRPVFDGSEINSVDGWDIETTLDVNLQDVAETALRKALSEHEADYGLVVVMEVASGEIKAMSNLTRDKNGFYQETYNYAVGGLHEPGSTFKLATMIALLEETNIKLTDSIDTGDGIYTIYNSKVRDHHEGGWGKLSIRESFEKSSNVAMAKLVEKHFSLHPEKFLNYVDNLHMSFPLNFQINGVGIPKIKRPGMDGWSGITLPWMAYGYGLEVTPLHTLTLFNAVANDGKMIKPIIVRSAGRAEEVIKTYETVVLNEKICSDKTLKQLQTMLQGVVEKGTATNIKGTHYKIAGKTGTSQILENGRYTSKYITSFAGYFPADNPKYSAIVLVKNPKGWRQYGSNVSAPVFKEIADNIYSRDIDMHEPFSLVSSAQMGVFPVIQAGKKDELQYLCNTLGISNHVSTDQDWVRTNIKGNAVQWVKGGVSYNQVPDVRGMTLRDALYLLENSGLRVSHNGIGRVSNQSLLPGQKVVKGELISLKLG
ncbi:MAG: transpeptidase family protein [Cyclobacteriaceae bacterium]|nr:transpeptidase family protein [Cyclobacteriaceae bacterium]